ncbi:MAG: hypothetical protein PHR77_02170 [Kiritimatiellae bacterium]|nr:hypothetical protein [Kiritimatiellia bacterium]MDD5521819.1 hypothetical protein [Kiritimatiellia bacterium]
MKATLDIPDTLYRQVKAKSALEGRRIRLVAIELFSTWVNATQKVESKENAQPSRKTRKLPPWFGIARSYASKVKRHDMDAVRESITHARVTS